MHSFELEYDDGTESESLREIFKVNVHRVTQELVILDPSGQVFVASIDSSNGQIRISKTSTLAFLPPNDFSLLLHTHIVICLTREHCWYFHLRTGKLLAEESLPVSIDNPLSKQVYCWKIATLAGSEKAPSKVGWWIPYLGIYEIKMNSPISSQLESAAKNKLLRLPSKESLKQNQTPVDKHLILALCREWKLDYLESKFILDLLFMNNTWTENSSFKLSSSDESVTVGSIAEHYAALIESLLSHLQSPALVLPLLSKNPSSKKFIVEKLEIFLQKYNNETKNKSSHNTNSSSLDVQANSTRLGALLSFQYHTPLNETIVPLLTQYVNSRKQQPLVLSSENPESTNYTPSSFRSILSLSGEEILLLNRSTFEQFCRKEPQLMLEKLENHFQIKTPNPNLGSFVHAEERKFQGPTGGRSQQLMLFEYMCQLYFAVEPEYLPKFIFQVSSAILSSSSPSNSNRPLIDKRYCLRALAVLPPLQKNESSNKLQTRVELLCYCGKFGMATKLLFLLDKWKETFQVLNRVYSQPPGAVGEDVKTELFSLLFSYCIKTRKYQLFQELWEFLPSSLTCLNLIQLLKQPSSTQDGNGKVSVLVRDEKDFPLSFLLPQFLKMIEKRKLENKKKI